MAQTLQEIEDALTAPGESFEMTEAEVVGQTLRVWKNAPHNMSAVFDAAAGWGDRTFVVYENERTTYRELHAQAVQLANVLRDAYGVAKGDRVAIAMRNYPEWPVAFWATLLAGAVAVPLNAWWTGPELEY